MTTTSPRLYRVPTPVSEPPYDDDGGPRRRAGQHGWVQGSLALAIPASAPTAPTAPLRRGSLRLVPEPAVDDTPRPVPGVDEDDLDSRPIPVVHRQWVARLAQALVEAINGDRPCGQLLPWTSDAVYAAVTDHAVRRARARPNVDLTRRAPTYVKTVRVAKPRPEVAEVCAVAHSSGRTQAIALRLEARRGRWRCTAFELA